MRRDRAKALLARRLALGALSGDSDWCAIVERQLGLYSHLRSLRSPSLGEPPARLRRLTAEWTLSDHAIVNDGSVVVCGFRITTRPAALLLWCSVCRAHEKQLEVLCQLDRCIEWERHAAR